MLPPFAFCPGLEEGALGRRRRQERRHRLLSAWRDSLERQIAAVSAALSTLERQMERDGEAPSS